MLAAWCHHMANSVSRQVRRGNTTVTEHVVFAHSALPPVSVGKAAHNSLTDEPAVVGGIDTHADLHRAAVIDSIGRHLATEQFETTPEGYRRLLNRLQSHGENLAVGIEGTGACGSEIAPFLAANGVTVVEVDRPGREAGRNNAKSASIDSYAAATAVLPGPDAGTPGLSTRELVDDLQRVSRRCGVRHPGPRPNRPFGPHPTGPRIAGGSPSLRWAVSHTELRAHGRHESVGVVLCQISTFRSRHAHCAERRPGRQGVRGVHGPRRRGR
ncbi:transposase [Streptomyces sp. NPDC058439]|uniref:IS110 family transposase n=1 Tax=Streptomyces sp. NPDC058439 TaxID=3346500 RepID=UPI00364F2BDF